ncbi:hypothetical protein DIJ64_03635 [Mycobacterium leprae]|uniref:Uncharacterized protein n=1 Tax=Mycobacterium leprae TaxID=1769 RepID=A0AAD0KR57_MYCLR|nr:hypothetical protein DIJ64_03635 [Mycobacterium leprae]OAR21700.1 hypothetical protein A8144_00345 [Mycobacterium leprae 3125609]OAX72238.1 hypothetical protein A3216_00405 [Mycobacterium leprae 7935681]
MWLLLGHSFVPASLPWPIHRSALANPVLPTAKAAEDQTLASLCIGVKFTLKVLKKGGADGG